MDGKKGMGLDGSRRQGGVATLMGRETNGDAQEEGKSRLQRELDTAARKVVREREEQMQPSQPGPQGLPKKTRSVMRLPLKDFENVRLCLNVRLIVNDCRL
jgi:hypothetical protein